MSNILTITAKKTVREWIEMLPECPLKKQALLRLPGRCESFTRNTILEAILCARANRESLDVYKDKEDWWMQLHDEIKIGTVTYNTLQHNSIPKK